MTIEEYLQQQGYVYRPENRVETDGGMSGNFGGYGKYRTTGGGEVPEVETFDEIERSDVAKYYEDPSRFITKRDTEFNQGVNTFNEGNENQKRILDQINTGQLYISPRLVAGKVSGEAERGGEGYREETVYDLRDSRTGEPVQQQVKAIDAEKGIFNIVADDPNSSGYFYNYVSTDPKGFVNPVVSEEQSQYQSKANSSLNFIKNSVKGLLSLAAIAGTAGGAGAALGSTLGIGTQAGTAALNAGLAALKQGVDGKFDPVTLATTAALSYAGAGGADPLTADDMYTGQAMTNLANSGGSEFTGAYTAPVTSVQPNLTVDDLYATDLGGLDTPVQPYDATPSVSRDFDFIDDVTTPSVSRDFDFIESTADQGTYQMGQGTSLSEDAATNRLNKFYKEANPESNLAPGGADANLAELDAFKKQLETNPLIPVGGAGIGGIELGSTGSILGSGQGLGQQTLSDVTPSGLKGLTLNELNSTDPKYYKDKSLIDKAYDAVKNLDKTDLALIGIGASALGGAGGTKNEMAEESADPAKKVYTSGAGQAIDPDYMLQRRINAGNVYSDVAGYKPLDYAEGGEVEHFAGGGLSNLLTRITQPIEKAILRPLGNAAPFLKDLAPYAGMAAGAMMGNPAMAAGIGGIASGFGKPGGFDMKRALMGGIAAYGMSNLAGGLEAAGGLDPSLPTSNLIGPPVGTLGENIPSAASNLVKEPSNMFSTRDPAAMQRGIGNLLQNSNTPAYKDAMTAFKGNVNLYNTGVPLVMGTTGMMGVDESNAMKQEYDKALGASQEASRKYAARIAAGKKRAEQAMNENPYMFAMGGAIDDEYGGDNMNTVNGNMQNGFMGYAEGGVPRFLSGGGDGMSDSIKAKIEGTQEARLADGEFVIPADVVSHLGNGSSKAGAKQLYDMMDRVRKARTGNPKQGREIKPAKLMPV